MDSNISRAIVFSDFPRAIKNVKNAYDSNDSSVQVQYLLQRAKENENRTGICWMPGYTNIKDN